LLQLQELIEIGSTVAQGFYFSKPLDESEIASKLAAA
jgi:EAL domain-containing protein (putative c-di-GMP-specific phosphodiesterase class I)